MRTFERNARFQERHNPLRQPISCPNSQPVVCRRIRSNEPSPDSKGIRQRNSPMYHALASRNVTRSHATRRQTSTTQGLNPVASGQTRTALLRTCRGSPGAPRAIVGEWQPQLHGLINRAQAFILVETRSRKNELSAKTRLAAMILLFMPCRSICQQQFRCPHHFPRRKTVIKRSAYGRSSTLGPICRCRSCQSTSRPSARDRDPSAGELPRLPH